MASTKRNSASSLNFRYKIQPESQRSEKKGSRPVPEPVSIHEALLIQVIGVLRKILFMNIKVKIGLYLAGLFLSFIFDFLPFPKTYLSRTDNVINVYFVKIGWFWTLLLTTPFVFLTSFTYCCGNKKLVFMHLSRILIATLVWFVFTKSFAFIEENFGKCSFQPSSKEGKRTCLSKGHFWYSLDISGHIFILIWSTLFITEEARAIIGWSQVKDMIQNEEYVRATNEIDLTTNLRYLSDEDLQTVKASYNKFSIYVKGLFIALTLLTLLWDLMVVTTILYFHIMVEKFIGGIFAILMWFITYKYWYPKLTIPPKMPGDGSFEYSKNKSTVKPKSYNSSGQTKSSLSIK